MERNQVSIDQFTEKVFNGFMEVTRCKVNPYRFGTLNDATPMYGEIGEVIEGIYSLFCHPVVKGGNHIIHQYGVDAREDALDFSEGAGEYPFEHACMLFKQ